MTHQIYIMEIDSNKLSTIWKIQAADLYLAVWKKLIWRFFFRPGPTDLQLEKFIQEIKIQSRGPRKRKRWDQVIKNLYPKFIFLAMLNENTEELSWLLMIVVLLKDASSLCLLRIPTHQYTYISPFLRKEGKPAYRTFLWLAVKWSHQCSCELYHVKKEMLCQ